MNHLLEALVDIKPKERGGISAGQGFSFQNNWAILKLIELHRSNKHDYALICEYHDDILVFDSLANNEVNFYQLKKRDRNWKINDLYSGDKFILGKLYEKKVSFGSKGKVHLFLVSNARYEVDLKNSSHKSKEFAIIKCTDINDKDRQKIKDHIQKRLNLDYSPDFDTCTELHTSTMSVLNPEDAVYTALINYFEAHQNIPLSILKPLHATLLVEIGRCANYDFTIQDKDELIGCRGITRKDFEGYLQQALKPTYDEKSLKDVFADVSSLLKTSSLTKAVQLEFRAMSNKYQIDKLNYSNSSFHSLEADIKALMNNTTDEENNLPVLEYRDAVFEKTQHPKFNKRGHENLYIKYIILFLFYGEDKSF